MTTLIQSLTCGYCNEELLLDEYAHECEAKLDIESAVVRHYPFKYSQESLHDADQFLIDNPEFREFQSLTAHVRIGAYESPEQLDHEALLTYETATGFPLETNLDFELTREEEWDSIYALRDNYQTLTELTYWRDVEPTRCTHAIFYWIPEFPYPVAYGEKHMPTSGKFHEASSYELAYESLNFEEKNLQRFSFTELQGFACEKLIDFGITEAYQYKLFNIYMGRDNNLHVGLLTFDQTSEGKPSVTCSHKGCYYRTHPFEFQGDINKLEDLQEFTSACIRHGNNHGPQFYVTRADFAFIHATNCDAQHLPKEACNANAPKHQFSTETLTEALDFIIQHRKFCRSIECRCTAYYHSLTHYSRELQVA